MKIQVEHNPAPAKLDVMGVYDWPIWEKEISTFPWTYDRKETCYFLEGDVTVTCANGEIIAMDVGDLVSFPKGLTCTWEIHVAVKKHYNFE